MNRLLDGVAAIICRWPWPILAFFAVAVAATAPGLARLDFDTQQDTLVPRDSDLFRDNARYQDEFGGGELVVVFTGDVLGLLEGENLARLEAMHDRVNAIPLLARAVGPDTVLKAAETEVAQRSARALADIARIQAETTASARAKALDEGKTAEEADAVAEQAAADAVSAYIKQQAAEADAFRGVGPLQRTNPKFVKAVVIGADGQVRPELRDLVPDLQHALFVTNVRGNLSASEGEAAADELRRSVSEAGFTGTQTTVTGEAILLAEISSDLEDSIPFLAGISIVLMVVVVLTIFRARWRLLHLPVVFAALAMALGLAGLLDLPFTMASTAGLPILVGLAVDFGIQFHTRYEEEFDRAGDAAVAMRRSLRRITPALVLALAAALIGFAALRYSLVPMVQDFAVLLGLGIVVVFVVCLFGLNAILFLRDRDATRLTEATSAPSRVERALGRTFRAVAPHPIPILAAGVALAVAGFVLDSRLEVETEPEQFLPSDSQAIKDTTFLSDLTGTSNQLNYLITAADVATPEVVSWMDGLQQKMLTSDARFAGADSMATFLRLGAQGADPDFSQASIDGLLASTPPDILKGFVNADHTAASITFRIRRDVKLAEQGPLLDAVKSVPPPPGVTIAPAGLGVIGVEAETRLTSNRVEMTIIAIAGALVLLLLALRNAAHAVLALLPVALVTGWAALAMYVFGVALNPLTAIAAPLIVALGTEFSLLLLLRYREECARGSAPEEAMATAYLRSGRAITASALTVAGAFVALAFDRFPLLQSFGIVSVLGTLLSLAGAMLLMPPLLIWTDRVLGERLHRWRLAVG